MHSHWYNATVVLLWLAAMTWLVCKKMVPTLLVGEPPSSRTILAARQDEPLVGWDISWDGRRLGWALNRTMPTVGGMVEIHSRVHFEQIPLSQSVPSWFREVFGQFSGRLQMELDNTLAYDALGRPTRFESAVRFLPVEEPVIKVKGTIDGAQMLLTIRSAEFSYETQLAAPRNAILNDAMSPQTRLPGLREGQSWTVEVYSPLQPPDPGNPKDPREILLAKVEGKEPVLWEGRPVLAWVVVYRSDSATASHHAAKPVGKVWVRPDGVILKQQVIFFGSTVTFMRLSDAQAVALAGQVRYRP